MGILHECVTLPSQIANAILGGISIEMKMKISPQLIPSCGQRDCHSMEARLLSTLVLRVTFFNEVPPRLPTHLKPGQQVGGRRRHGLLCASLRTSMPIPTCCFLKHHAIGRLFLDIGYHARTVALDRRESDTRLAFARDECPPAGYQFFAGLDRLNPDPINSIILLYDALEKYFS